ncbi:biotin/lipoyl-containing protein, partial [Neoroseomonas rubea]|uniref:biotin/lipoyl-containing protein n=1 Tax=Neoroseomonas rubea TaxID=2748666 RepID=UPI002FCD413E
MSEFRMPSLGADMEAGTLVEWKVGPGDRVRQGDIVAVVETQKGAIEIEIFAEGVVRELVVAPGSSVPVGALLARLDAEAGRLAPAPAKPIGPPPVVAPPPVPPPLAPAPTTGMRHVRATPAA